MPIYNYDEITPLDKSIYYDEKEYLYGKDIGFFVAPKYKDAKREFIISCLDQDKRADFIRLGGMTNGHMPGTYYFLASDYYKRLK